MTLTPRNEFEAKAFKRFLTDGPEHVSLTEMAAVTAMSSPLTRNPIISGIVTRSGKASATIRLPSVYVGMEYFVVFKTALDPDINPRLQP